MPLDDRAGHGTHWQSWGHGPRPALAVHCMLGHSGPWGLIGEALGDQITLTGFDLPGHGKSAPWAGESEPGGYQKLATQVAASFVDRPIDLIGHSFGALVALRLAVAAPQAIRTLTLIEPVLFAAVRGTPDWDAVWPGQARLEAMLAEGRAEEAARAFMKDWGAGVPWEAMPPAQRARFTEQMGVVQAVTAANFADPGNILREDGLEGIDAPVLIIRGETSPAIIAPVCEAIAARLPDVGLAVVPGAGHMLPLTHAKQTAELIALNLERQ
jgi:pimeloyl-ACP methyl ester carboxylesterase